MNKLGGAVLTILSIASGLLLAPGQIKPASAQCVQSHVGVQLNMSNKPAEQTHNVQMESQGPCSGNTSSTTSTQVNVGGRGNARQHQDVRHEQRGGSGNGTGVSGPTVQSSVVVPVNVQTPDNFNP